MIKVGELRNQITQNAKKTKNKIALQKLSLISDLLQKRYDEKDYKLLSEAEWLQTSAILEVLQLQDVRYLRSVKVIIDNFAK